MPQTARTGFAERPPAIQDREDGGPVGPVWRQRPRRLAGRAGLNAQGTCQNEEVGPEQGSKSQAKAGGVGR